MKASIITSVYKGEKYINHFLNDITKQTIFNQCELIIINADSPENEEQYINPFLEKYAADIHPAVPPPITSIDLIISIPHCLKMCLVFRLEF